MLCQSRAEQSRGLRAGGKASLTAPDQAVEELVGRELLPRGLAWRGGAARIRSPLPRAEVWALRPGPLVQWGGAGARGTAEWAEAGYY